MAESGNYIRQNWKPILWGLIPFLLIVVIFALPLKQVTLEDRSTYWVSELQQQPYTETETYQVIEAVTETGNRTETIFDGRIGETWSYSFADLKPGARVSVAFAGYPYCPQPYVLYSYSDNYTYPFWPFQNYYWDAMYYPMLKITIKATYEGDITTYQPVTKTREVTKYREVSVPVQKERVVTRQVRVPIWQYIFMNRS
jgi:hypothetical protein